MNRKRALKWMKNREHADARTKRLRVRDLELAKIHTQMAQAEMWLRANIPPADLKYGSDALREMLTTA